MHFFISIIASSRPIVTRLNRSSSALRSRN